VHWRGRGRIKRPTFGFRFNFLSRPSSPQVELSV
jgi:hypothetical protein